MCELMMSYKYYIKNINSQRYLGLFAAETIETWKAISSTTITPTAIKISVPMATQYFPVPFSKSDFNIH